MVALWVAYLLSFAYAAIFVSARLISSPPVPVAPVVTWLALSRLSYAALIYFVSSGRYWARLIYAVLLGVHTVSVIRGAPAAWQYSEVFVLMTAITLMCQYTAMYWLFTEPGRRWFMR
jgi:hypothetical protein